MKRRTALAEGLRALLLMVGLAACQGDGSDVGPNLGAKPAEPFQVQLFDDESQPVCGARVILQQSIAVSGRAGRAEAAERPSGTFVFQVDASTGSATDRDMLQGFVVAAESVDDRRGIGRALYLPDLSTSNGLNVPAGVQASGAVLDDIANGGGLLIVNAGAVISNGTAAVVTLQTAQLAPRHLPRAVPTANGFAALVSRAIMVAPPTALLGSGVVLAVPDDLGAAGTSAAIDLLRLDEQSGMWVRVGAGVASPGRIETPLPGIDRGGLYVFAASTPCVAAVSGRIVDAAGMALPRVLVQASGLATTTALDGTFELPGLAVFDLAGNQRTEVIELVGGRGLLPVTITTLATLSDGPVLLGDRTLDTVASAHLRLLLVERGAVLGDRRVRTSETLGQALAETYVGSDGTAVFEDLAIGLYGITFGRPSDRLTGFRTTGLVRLRREDRNVDARLFSLRGPYDDQRRGSSVLVFDVEGGGPVQDAVIVRGTEPDKGFLNRTFEGGVAFVGLNVGDQVTAVSDRLGGSRRVISAFTTLVAPAHRVELPVRTSPHERIGSFERHGLVSGRVTGGVANRARELRVSYPLPYRDWFARVMLDATVAGGRVPVKVGPSADADVVFTAGVPLPRGHLALIETRPAVGGNVVEGAFVAFDLAPPEAVRVPVEGAFLRRDTSFTTSQQPGRDPRIGVLVADWGAENSAGTIADVARGTIPVGTRFMGGHLTFDLPGLNGVLAGGRHHMCVRGAESVGGATIEQRQVIPLTQTLGNAAAPLLAVPTLLEPAPGAVVSADGFRVGFTPPADATFVMVRLIRDDPGELREWTALLPATTTSFSFRRLPPEATPVLAAGLAWRLEVTAFRVTYGPFALEPDLYSTVISNVVTLGLGGLGVDALSRVSIPITTL